LTMRDGERVKVWITKYALTQGIIVTHAVITRTSENMIWVEGKDIPWGGYGDTFHGEGTDGHRSEAAALERAEAMRTRKLASLERSRKKAEALDFLKTMRVVKP